jgi:hypothetical protein
MDDMCFKGKIFLGKRAFQLVLDETGAINSSGVFVRGVVTFIRHQYLTDYQAITMDPDLIDAVGELQ